MLPHVSQDTSESSAQVVVKKEQDIIDIASEIEEAEAETNDQRELDEEAFELGILREREGRDLGGASVIPIRSVQAGVFSFENWIEEGKAKFEIKDEDSSKTSFSSIFN